MRRKKQQHEEVSEHTAVHPSLADFAVEMSALGGSFQTARFGSVDLISEADDMASARADVEDLVSRGYTVTHATFDRLEALMKALRAIETNQEDLIRDRKARNAAAEEARVRFMEVRGLIVRVADAEEYEELPDVETSRTDEFVEGMTRFLERARQWAPRFDKERVESWLREAEALHHQVKASLADAKAMDSARTNATDQAERIRRLLFDTLREVSKMGLAAYPGEIERQRPYQLERFAARKSKRDASPETDPPAGGDSDPGVTE